MTYSFPITSFVADRKRDARIDLDYLPACEFKVRVPIKSPMHQRNRVEYSIQLADSVTVRIIRKHQTMNRSPQRCARKGWGWLSWRLHLLSLMSVK